ncbi:MAG: hypothetical protein Q8N23_13320 [Archangium sp.]|nr:hypothetical protein [Archangium sp.]MDP3569300.1 hypothetical protein [Archangium sp.]
MQKSFAGPTLGQHCEPLPPQVEHAPAAHTPRPAPQLAASATQVVPAQQPAAPHVLFAQHGWLGPPQATRVPALHTVPPGPSAPDGRQVPEAASKQPPARQALPGQAG